MGRDAAARESAALAPLVGAVITAVDAFQDETCSPFEAWPVLTVRLQDGTERTILVSRDPEGNGPGHLSVDLGG